MKMVYAGLSETQRLNAVQRLTALWAFTECGLGGIMHALQIPFTGLLVGGMAVIMICLIAALSAPDYKQILKSALIVLIVKAMISPYTPFPAYIAVGFQALLGYLLFRTMRVNFISIVLLSSIAMLESAIQKILILTLFFGESLWKAMDSLLALLARQFGSTLTNGSYWIIGIYLLLYIAGGFFIASLAYRIIKNFNADKTLVILDTSLLIQADLLNTNKNKSKNHYRKLWMLILVMFCLSAVLFIAAADHKTGWLSVAKTISWTLSAILAWFMLIGPLFTKAIQKLLKKKESRYSDEVLKALSFLPVLKQLTALAWQQSKPYPGISRWHFFFTALIHAALTYSESLSPDINLKQPL